MTLAAKDLLKGMNNQVTVFVRQLGFYQIQNMIELMTMNISRVITKKTLDDFSRLCVEQVLLGHQPRKFRKNEFDKDPNRKKKKPEEYGEYSDSDADSICAHFGFGSGLIEDHDIDRAKKNDTLQDVNYGISSKIIEKLLSMTSTNNKLLTQDYSYNLLKQITLMLQTFTHDYTQKLSQLDTTLVQSKWTNYFMHGFKLDTQEASYNHSIDVYTMCCKI